MSDEADSDDVGSLADEAAKLLGALSGWARDHAGEASDGLAGFAAHASVPIHDLNEHLATGAVECTTCPVCRTVHAVRQLSPEVRVHLTAAVTSLAQAATAVMATSDRRSDNRGDGTHVERDDDWSAS